MNSLKNICINCGKQGHQFKSCNEPIISYGVICFNMGSIVNNKQIENYFYNKFLDIGEFNYTNLNNLAMIPYFYDKIKILMVRRKNSLNYIEFIRGKYDVDNIQHLTKVFGLMTRDENLKIASSNFDQLWNELWKKTAKSKIYQKEFYLSKLKFNIIFVTYNNKSRFSRTCRSNIIIICISEIFLYKWNINICDTAVSIS